MTASFHFRVAWRMSWSCQRHRRWSRLGTVWPCWTIVKEEHGNVPSRYLRRPKPKNKAVNWAFQGKWLRVLSLKGNWAAILIEQQHWLSLNYVRDLKEQQQQEREDDWWKTQRPFVKGREKKGKKLKDQARWSKGSNTMRSLIWSEFDCYTLKKMLFTSDTTYRDIHLLLLVLQGEFWWNWGRDFSNLFEILVGKPNLAVKRLAQSRFVER